MAKITIEGTPEQIEEGIKALCPSCAGKDAALCQAREALGGMGHADWCEYQQEPHFSCTCSYGEIEQALSSTGPCRHEGRIRELEEFHELIRK
jgi:hypothetical protein